MTPEPETWLMVLSQPIGGYGRVWPALQLRRPVEGLPPGASPHVTVARSASVPLGAIYDMADDDLAEAVAWVNGAALP